MTARYILTGTPGSGKTSIIQALKVRGYFIIEEAATDVIKISQSAGLQEPWKNQDFIDKIIVLQKQRQLQTELDGIQSVQFYDRSPICTYALVTYLGYNPSTSLMAEIERIERSKIYQKRVFFIENLGFCTPTEARKISFKEALDFEKIHIDTYLKYGYELINIPAGSIKERTREILTHAQVLD